MAGAPDLFVVCKNCQSEVSPYITECPYCGQRLRKRAPKLDREGRPSEPVAPPPEPAAKPRKPPRPSKPPRARARAEREPRRGPRRPLVTIVVVLAGLMLTLAFQAGLLPTGAVIVDGLVEDQWWRLLTTSFIYASVGYEAVGLTTIAVFGWLLERRHGGWATLGVYVSATVVGSTLVLLLDPGALTMGGYAPALGLLCAWAVRDVWGRRRGEEDESDMLGVAVWVALLALLPLATGEAHALAGVGGALTGLLLGVPLARLRER